MTDEYREAYAAALKILGRRDYFRAELERRLVKKGWQTGAVEQALERCRQLGYLDDRRLAFRFAEIRAVQRGWGPLRILNELRSRGVAGDIAREASDLPDRIAAPALDQALRRAEVRARDGWWRAGEGRARMVSSLLRRGFRSEDAHQGVKDLAAQREASTHAIDDQPGDPEGVS